MRMPETSSPATVKLTANLHPEIIGALRQIAAARRICLTEALRQSISHEKYRLEAIDSGRRFILFDEDSGEYKELIF